MNKTIWALVLVGLIGGVFAESMSPNYLYEKTPTEYLKVFSENKISIGDLNPLVSDISVVRLNDVSLLAYSLDGRPMSQVLDGDDAVYYGGYFVKVGYASGTTLYNVELYKAVNWNFVKKPAYVGGGYHKPPPPPPPKCCKICKKGEICPNDFCRICPIFP